MEERQPINPEDLPETEQPKHDAFYTIGIACLIFLFIIGLISFPHNHVVYIKSSGDLISN